MSTTTNLLTSSYRYCDVATSWQLFFQDPATNEMEAITDLYNNIFVGLLIILGLVLWLLIRVTSQFHHTLNTVAKNLPHELTVELLWTIVPMVVIGLIILPNFKLLYLQAKMVDSGLTLKILETQWYWQHELYSSDATMQDLDAYMVKEYELSGGKFRLLEATPSIF